MNNLNLTNKNSRETKILDKSPAKFLVILKVRKNRNYMNMNNYLISQQMKTRNSV
jgi:hypothetical protein